MKEKFKEIRTNILNHIIHLSKNEKPYLAIIQVGNNAASNVYVKNKEKTCAEVGIETKIYHINDDCKIESLKEIIELLSKMDWVHGIILQLPLPDHLKPYEQELLDLIPYYKDVDGLSTESVGRLWTGEGFCLCPATAVATKMFLFNTCCLSGMNVAIIGRSSLIGKPLMKLLLDENCTIHVYHSKSNTKNVFKEHDIVISGIGNTSLCDYWDDKFNCLWVDCGIIRNNGKVHGDAGELVSEYITPVPGGIGTLTTACIALNTLNAYLYQKGMKKNESN